METTAAIKFGKTVASITKEFKSKSASIVSPTLFGNSGLTQFLIGFYDAVYHDRRYRSVPTAEEKAKLYTQTSLTLIGCTEAMVKDVALTHKLTKMIVSGVDFAKDLVMPVLPLCPW